MAAVASGSASTDGATGRYRRRIVPATLASALLLTGIAAAGRPGAETGRTQTAAVVQEASPERPTPWSTLATPTPTPTPEPAPTTVPPTATATASPTPTAAPTPTPTPMADLGALSAGLARQVDPDGDGTVAITIVHDGVTTSTRGKESVVSASAAKLYWAVAAADRTDDPTSLDRVADAVFGWSDNDQAGRLIDAAGGVDAINEYTGALGLERTSLSAWSYGDGRFASDRAERGNENLTSTDDLAGFLDAFASGQLLDPDEQAIVEAWMRVTPDDLASSPGIDGLLADALPADVAADAMHKAGWLPPGCCSVIDHVLVVGGVVPLPDGGWFTIAIAAQDTPDFAAAQAWIPVAVCEVYAALAGDVACDAQS